MKAYVVNESVTAGELAQLAAAAGTSFTVEIWPTATANLPSDANVAILIVRSASSTLEEARAMASVRASIRIVCVYLEDILEISDVAKKYCSAKVAIGAGGLGAALDGSDAIQQATSGDVAPKSVNKHHNC
ncbi:hypothetical protein GVN24_34665 [Rhizobium sp. CRIBSB]|nr:hypothetical protein [Rhizobium sp. CRIBSB]